MIRLIRWCVGCVAVVGLLAGCASTGGGGEDFSRSINQIQPGTPKATVLRSLGQPDEKRSGVAGGQPTGPQPPPMVRTGSRYEHWLYKRGDTHYHVFLGASTEHPGQWVVVSRSANPATADPAR